MRKNIGLWLVVIVMSVMSYVIYDVSLLLAVTFGLATIVMSMMIIVDSIEAKKDI